MPQAATIVIRPGSATQLERRASLLPVPLFAIAVAVLGQFVTRRIDVRVLDRGYDPPLILDRGGPDDVRALLATVAGASITVLALVLSLTMVTLSMAATQFGPRLIGAFLKSGIAKATIGIFTGLFVYSLLVLDSVATTGDTNQQVPILGTTISLVIAIVAVTCLVWYANAVAESVRLPRVVQVLADDLRTAVTAAASSPITKRLDTLPSHERSALVERLEADGADLVADTSGYLQQVELESILEAATGMGAVVWCTARPGDFVMAGTRLVRVSPAASAPALAAVCERSIDLGAHRTIDQDIEFAIDQMVEIALRALSPAINDTFTAITCIDWLGTALRFLAEATTDRPVLRDDTGTVRILTRPRPFPGLVDAAYDKIRQAGAGNPAITIHLIDTIRQVVELVDDHDADRELLVQAHMVVSAAWACEYTSRDWDELYDRYARLCTSASMVPMQFA